MEKEIRKILFNNFGYGDADKAVKELLVLFDVSNNEERVAVCEICNDTHDVITICKDCIIAKCNDRI